MFNDVRSVEDGDEDRGEDRFSRFLVVYRVRVCTRCNHPACQYCGGTFCDSCFDSASRSEEGDLIVNCDCALEQECVYLESEEDAVVEVSRTKITAEEEAAFNAEDENTEPSLFNHR